MGSKKVSIVTLGCAKNTVDTDNLARLLKARGYETVEDPSEAGTIVVHTCSFIEAAKKESIDAILAAGRTKGEDKKLIVSGCLVQQHGDEIFNDLPEVDAFLGTGQLAQIPDLIANPRARFISKANPGGFMDPDVPRERLALRPDGTANPTSYLRLSEGCSHPCTFCVIPRLRGPVQSRSEEAILKEARELAKQGVEELVVIGQDTGDWGRERAQSGRLPELLRSIGAVPGIRWVRLMYMHPASFTDPLLELFAEQPDKFPYLDMPLQHIDSTVLAQMQRKTDEKGLRRLLEKVKTKVPRLSLRTTFIVGFPGETELQFERLVSFVREGHFDYLGAFSYSKEEGTPAARRADEVPEQERKDRLEALTNAYYDSAYRKAESRIGQVETVLIDEQEGDEVIGRTRREAPEIDAVLRLPASAARQGRFIQARITAYDAHQFSAVPVQVSSDRFIV